AGGDQDQAGNEGAQQQAAVAEAFDDVEHHRDEGGGGTADLHTRTAQGGDQGAGDDGGVQALVRRRPGSDGQGHGQRQGHDGDGETGDDVAAEIQPRVAVAQDRDQLGQVQVPGGG